MRKTANVLQLITLIALFIIGGVDVNDLTIWHVVAAVIAFIPFVIGKVLERCLED